MKRITAVLAALACVTLAVPTIASARDGMYRGGWHHHMHRGTVARGRVPGDVMAPDRPGNPVGDVMAPDRGRVPGDVMAPSRR